MLHTSVKNKTRPISVGEILEDDFLIPIGISRQEFSKKVGLDLYTIDDIIDNHSDITEEQAELFADYFNVSKEFWLNTQRSYTARTNKMADKQRQY